MVWKNILKCLSVIALINKYTVYPNDICKQMLHFVKNNYKVKVQIILVLILNKIFVVLLLNNNFLRILKNK